MWLGSFVRHARRLEDAAVARSKLHLEEARLRPHGSARVERRPAYDADRHVRPLPSARLSRHRRSLRGCCLVPLCKAACSLLWVTTGISSCVFVPLPPVRFSHMQALGQVRASGGVPSVALQVGRRTGAPVACIASALTQPVVVSQKCTARGHRAIVQSFVKVHGGLHTGDVCRLHELWGLA